MLLGVLIAGVLLIVSGVKGTEVKLGAQLQQDLLGGPNDQSGFLAWLAALLIIGALGYIPALAKPSKYLLILLLVVILFANNGFFGQLFTSIATIQQPNTKAEPATPLNSYGAGGSGGSGSGGSSSSGGGGILGALGSVGSIASTIFSIF